MDIRFLDANMWQLFEQQFPTAAQWLRVASLKEEKRALEAELATFEVDTRRRVWIERRLDELNRYFSALREGEG